MIDTIKKQSLKSLLNIFDTTLDSTVNQVWNEKDKSDHLEALVNGASKITHHILELGEFVRIGMDEDSLTPTELLPSYIIQYTWIDEAKSFLILWRDVIFQYQKALVLESNQKISNENLEQLWAKSKSVVQNGVVHLKDFLEKETSSIAQKPKELKAKMADWKKIQNPWTTYRKQIETINEQCKKLREQNQILLNLYFESIF